jgi:hypothetical protein
LTALTTRNAVSGLRMGLLALMIAGGSAYAGDDPKAYGKVCKDNGDFGLSHSTCVVCMAQGEEAAACFCRELGFTGEEYGHCVSGAGASNLSLVTFSTLMIGGIAFKLRRRVKSLYS